jgi:hypothetical protein
MGLNALFFHSSLHMCVIVQKTTRWMYSDFFLLFACLWSSKNLEGRYILILIYSMLLPIAIYVMLSIIQPIHHEFWMQVTGTFDTNKCQLPCSLCLHPKEDLRKTNQRLEYETQSMMKSIFNQMMEFNIYDNNIISKTYSLHAIEVCKNSV